MLHEILLSLSGHTSPLLSVTASKGDGRQSNQTFPGLSYPEQALIASLAHLGDLHARLQTRTSVISSTHRSTICRAVSTAISSTHLARFQRAILEFESSILRKDASIVGGYGIVPLSKVVDEFGQWTRRMDWFWDMVQFMLPDEPRAKKSTEDQSQCSGAAVLDRLRKEVQTGYPDIEEVALDLIKAGETAWLRQLSGWVLYGRLPAFGEGDFFICTDTSTSHTSSATTTTRLPDFHARHELIPGFVAPSTASAILFIGRSLNQIRARVNAVARSSSTARTSPELLLVPAHLEHLAAVATPINQSFLSSAISTIRLSLSRNSLQQLLPLHRIQEILRIFRNFFLLDHGEFAVALLDEAQKRIRSRHRRPMAPHRGGLSNDLGSLNIKESEANLVLTRTWATLSTSQSHDDDVEEEMDLARGLMHFTHPETSDPSSKPQSIASQQHRTAAVSGVPFNDFLFATPTFLTIQITSPLDLFLRPQDVKTYSNIHSYVLSIRRAHLHLTELWRLTSLRRDHPAPLGPPASNTRNGAKTLARNRQLELNRRKAMRSIWATVGATLFLLTELSAYFQGEVIMRSSDKLRIWLQPTPSSSQRAPRELSRHTSSTSVQDGGNGCGTTNTSAITASAANLSISTSPDPETLTTAHQRYLKSLVHNLLLTDTVFTKSLRSFLVHIDHFVALLTRLHSIQQSMDLGINEAVADPFADYAAEGSELMIDLRNATKELHRGNQMLVTRLREMDSERVSGDDQFLIDVEIEDGGFVPWHGSGLDRLLMKLDFASLAMNQE